MITARSLMLVLITMTGCGVHAGPTFGYRRGTFTPGWRAGAGVTALDIVVGHSFGERPVSYGGLWGWLPVLFPEDKGGTASCDCALGPSAMVGLSVDQGELGFAGSIGVAALRFWNAADVSGADSAVTATLTFELRWLGPEVELTVSPQVGYVWFPPFGN